MDDAEKDCERFFAEVPRGRLHYTEFADACLVRGYLREQRGDHPGALAAWREGLFRTWPGGIPNPTRPAASTAWASAGVRIASPGASCSAPSPAT